MKHKISRVYNGSLDEYKHVLGRFDATYHTDEIYEHKHYAMIELKSISDLKELVKEMDQDIIVSNWADYLIIYDDYME